jgi:phage-related baseplate assembly protein
MVEKLTAKYEEFTNRTVHPASPQKLFIQWVASAMVLLAEQINFAGNQNIPSKAVGGGLDNIAQIFFVKTRPQAKPATVTLQFTISEAQTTAILVPAGTRVTTADQKIVFVTDKDVYVAAGDTTVTVTATCETVGTEGNGYEVGQLNTCVDLFAYYTGVTNTTMSDGGSNTASDDEFYDLMVTGQDAYTSAGARGAYEYYTRRVSTEIRDVVVNSPSPCEVNIYAVMNDGTLASSEMKAAILAACNEEDIRPLTDQVSVKDAELVEYDITMTYYLSRDSTESAAVIQENVEAAVQKFISWENAQIGRDINPSKLNQMVVDAGAKRTVITSPTFTVLKNGTVDDPNEAEPEDYIPQLAKIGTVTLTNGGYEDE